MSKAAHNVSEQHAVEYALVFSNGNEVGHFKQMSSGRVGITLNNEAGVFRGHKLLRNKQEALQFVQRVFPQVLVSRWVQL